MTMLQSVYQDSCKGLKLDSGKKQWPLLREYIEKQLQTVSSAVVAAHINRIYLAVEEFYVNAVSYAYGEKNGPIWVHCLADEVGCVIRIEDAGQPFNPLAVETPKLELSLEDCEEGGLGIFLSRQVMDKIEYVYENRHNVLWLTKYWQSE